VTQQWRTRDAPAVAAMPVGAWGAAGLAAKAGDPCKTNEGEPGVLREEGGWLYCEASYLGPTRSGEQSAGDVPVTRADAVPTSRAAIDAMSAAEGQAIKDAAWNEMCAELRDAWKPKN
jgi:hypothetical protein